MGPRFGESVILTGGGRCFSVEVEAETEESWEVPAVRCMGGISCSSCCGEGWGDSTVSSLVGDLCGNCAHLKEGCRLNGLDSSYKE